MLRELWLKWGGEALLTTPRRQAWLIALLMVVGAVLCVSVGDITLAPAEQAYISIGTITLFFILNRRPGRHITCILMMLSLFVSFRYLIWRLGSTVEFHGPLQVAMSLALLGAEGYALSTLCLSYFQMSWPLGRKPHRLPDDPADWPMVDVYVPSYNEDLELVRSTVLGAMDLHWPADKLNVYILDDGRRKAFRDFAVESGAGYIIRAENNHAKAGNLNHAMKITKGEFVVIFDCDHVPTRSFLLKTIGWLWADPKLALLQTPHHFYSPDPFQRNLAAGYDVPPEGNMFYGLIQDGNDFWDATFFCGSCAAIRRSALLSVGGFATETVTEDAHTALKMQRKGWGTAYLCQPLAAGLATERLILHIGQRVRWARGMLQIMRRDNPMLGGGLRWEQRLCYLSAMSHFLFAIPRVTFLVSPLGFLFFGQNIIAASPFAIMVYALPHIFHSIMTLSRIEGRWRYSFWSEIYETSLALFLIRITIVTLLQPHKGKFNVTDKGGLLARGYFDFSAVYPNAIMAIILFGGMVRGIWGMIFQYHQKLAFQSFALNTLWITVSLIVVLASIAVGRETRQIRHKPRVRVKLPVEVCFADGRVFQAHTTDISLGGAGVTMHLPEQIETPVDITLRYSKPDDGIDIAVPARILGQQRGSWLHLQWKLDTLEEEREVVSLVFGRSDAWHNWADFKDDRPLNSIYQVIKSIGGLLAPPYLWSLPSKGQEESSESVHKEETLEKKSLVIPPVPHRLGTGIIMLLVGAMLAAIPARAQMPPGYSHTGVSHLTPLGDTNSGDIPPATDTLDQKLADRVADAEITRTIAFRDLSRFPGPLTLRGFSPLQGVDVVVPANRVVTHATLHLSGAISPSLLPEATAITVTLNEQYVGTIRIDPAHPTFGPIEFSIDPLYFTGDSKLNFRFAGEYRRDCNDLYNDVLWAQISDQSTITLTTARIEPVRSLSRLPTPFFDSNLKVAMRVPMVLPGSAMAPEVLRAGGLVASWFGRLADTRQLTFPVARTLPDTGNAIEIGPRIAIDDRGTPPSGPTLFEIANPNDKWGTILVVTGRTPAEVEVAARTLVFSPDTLGDLPGAVVEDVTLRPRVAYDAPSFIPTDRPVRFGELVTAGDLQAGGFAPDTLHVPFHLPPDLYTWHRLPFLMDLWVRAPGNPVVDIAASRLDVSVNNTYIQSYSLLNNNLWRIWSERMVTEHAGAVGHVTAIPPWLLFGQNDLQFQFDTRPVERGACRRTPDSPHLEIDSDSVLDFRRGVHFTELPNLSYFAEIGFPFSRMADLGETTVVLPPAPDTDTIGAYFDLMGFFGSVTWYPVSGIHLATTEDIAHTPPEGDVILLAPVGQMGAAATLLSRSAYRIDGDHIRVGQQTGLQGIWYIFQDRDGSGLRNGVTANLDMPVRNAALMIGSESPYASHRSVLALVGDNGIRIHELVASLHDPKVLPTIQGDLVIKNGEHFTTYRTSPTYTVGHLPWWMWVDWFLSRHPMLMYLCGVTGAVMLGTGAWLWLRARARRRVKAQEKLDEETARGEHH
ncbi:cellulose synthase catalytic subunit (UDP-forming) [Komagataeibacter rhaeticus]|uniref:UDP-forming cellulose synthase catalytic subunit n=1 Tax=Komagataeibacter rhaeticus TaxID=215221 RepID=UPI000DA00A06|nr:UDP-forming cellulose synthase catalytic subunit [Komagataeibacter rhaeticus]PYD54488.1 cellulose synthase catalytic subunit (UDP-forming) [Komagataeibacter rhaeticus]GBQ13668.1 cellulose synthase catalytic subunit [Komagataeibacter rhaeticus DSM 16663]